MVRVCLKTHRLVTSSPYPKSTQLCLSNLRFFLHSCPDPGLSLNQILTAPGKDEEMFDVDERDIDGSGNEEILSVQSKDGFECAGLSKMGVRQ